MPKDTEIIAEEIPGMEPGKTGRNLGLAVVYAIVGFALIGAIAGSGGGSTTDGSTAPSGTPPATPTTEEQIKASVRDAASVDTIQEVRVIDTQEATDKVISVEAREDSYLDSEDAVRTGTETTFEISKQLYTSRDDIERVEVYIYGDFTDQSGEKSEEKAVTVKLSQDTAQQIDWDGLEDRMTVDYKNFLDVADSYIVRQTICEDLDDLYPDCNK